MQSSDPFDYLYNDSSCKEQLDENFVNLIDALQLHSNLKTINLSNSSIGFKTLLDIFKPFSIHHSPPIIEVLPHTIDFSCGIIRYADKIKNTDLRLLLKAFKSKAPIKCVQCKGIPAFTNFSTIVAIFQILSINNFLIDVDISPHITDSQSGIFSFSPEFHTEITTKSISVLLSLEIIHLRINKCSFSKAAFQVLCDYIKTSTSLTHLDLSYCQLYDEDFLMIVDSIRLNCSLNVRELRFESIYIGDECTKALTELMKLNSTMKLII
ncbi:hypothetical protein GEMRC1_010256 [Eukaryota sp. GEM-RC1]